MNLLNYLRDRTTKATSSELKFLLAQVDFMEKKEAMQAQYEEYDSIKKLFSLSFLDFLQRDKFKTESENPTILEILELTASKFERYIELEKLLYSNTECSIPNHLLPITLFGSPTLAEKFLRSNKHDRATFIASERFHECWNALLECTEDKVTSILLPQLPLPSSTSRSNPVNLHIPNLRYIKFEAAESYKYQFREIITQKLLGSSKITTDEYNEVKDFCKRENFKITPAILNNIAKAQKNLSEELFELLEVDKITSDTNICEAVYDIIAILQTPFGISDSWKRYVVENCHKHPYHFTFSSGRHDMNSLCMFLMQYPEYIQRVKDIYGPEFATMAGRVLHSIVLIASPINWDGVTKLVMESTRLAKVSSSQTFQILAKIIKQPPDENTFKTLLAHDSSTRSVREIIGLYGMRTCQPNILKLIRLSTPLIKSFKDVITLWTSKQQIEDLCKLLPKHAQFFKTLVAKKIFLSIPMGTNQEISKESLIKTWEISRTEKPQPEHCWTGATSGSEQLEYLIELMPEILDQFTQSDIARIVNQNLEEMLGIPDALLADPTLLEHTSAKNVLKIIQLSKATKEQVTKLVLAKFKQADVASLLELLKTGIQFPENATHTILALCDDKYSSRPPNITSFAPLFNSTSKA